MRYAYNGEPTVFLQYDFMIMKALPILLIALFALRAVAQDSFDTIPVIELKGIEISTVRAPQAMSRLPQVYGMVIVAGKKNEVIDLTKSSADLASASHRQVFARVPGIMIWESDGSGIQIGIASRGLSPNRSWEFNNRQNGYDITPDVFGYPEAYYTPPLEALQRIEIIRGAASLQFGPQFGGMVNYVMKNGSGNKPFFYEGKQSLGSFQLVDSYNAFGGTKGKWSYYAFVQQRSAQGWRENSAFTSRTAYASVEYRMTEKCKLGLNYTHSEFLSQQPGGLTQEQFETDWRQSTRSRNWLNIPWNVASLYADIKTTAHSSLSIKTFGIMADRSSVGFLKAITIADTINAATDAYNFRKLDVDHYQTWGAEARWLVNYSLGNQDAHLAIGVRYSDAHTHRLVDGLGTTAADFDGNLAQGEFAKDLSYDNINKAFFAENVFRVGEKFSVTPGIRVEQLDSKSNGRIALNVAQFEPIQRIRLVPLAGIGLQYEFASSNIYANASQAYRPVTYSDLTPAGTTDIIDPNLKDASGYNADCGWRGSIADALQFDVGVFYLYYDNRIGTLQRDGVNWKTNIGTSVSKGVECFVETMPIKLLPKHALTMFVSGSLMDARYTRWDNPLIADDPLLSIAKKQVEYAPRSTCRAGLDYKINGLTVHAQWSFVDKVFTDAANTVVPTANAQSGKLSAYSLLDASVKYVFSEALHVQFSANNVLDTKYATRRSGGYPGPGLLPGTGRCFALSIGLRID
jgi:Fe(3+) dicitrate transport protein